MDNVKFDLNEAIEQRMMLAFEGTQPPKEILSVLEKRKIAGFTLFRELNVSDPAQIRVLTENLQSAYTVADDQLLIAIDQEGGQLLSLGEGTTSFIGNMALGAVGDPVLTEHVGYAMGKEMRALGININYAPVCDLNTNPKNPSLGIRSFGDDPQAVAKLTSAMVAGLQRAGVAATLKHFPGKGNANVDSHHQLPLINHSRERLEEVELPPFRSAIEAGAKLVMTGHFAIPVLTGTRGLPATLSRRVMHDFLRYDMGFEGVVISDALDMRALTQGDDQIIDVIAAIRAGVDLLLFTKDIQIQERMYRGIQLACSRGLIGESHLLPSLGRIQALRQWVGNFSQPSFDVIGCAEHKELAKELAQRSVTLVRNDKGLLPLVSDRYERIDIVIPHPADLTPADTSSFVRPSLADILRRRGHTNVHEWIVPQQPSLDEVAKLKEEVRESDLIIVGTISASMQTQQAEVVNALLALATNVITVAMRTPYDLEVYPASETHICTYSILEPAMEALAAALWGEIPFLGNLPVKLTI